MESSEREPSYYEVALTHRQLMVGLVVALTTVVVAFFAGVWIGRGAAPPASNAVADAGGAAARAEADKITFFGDKGEGAKPGSKPAPIAPKPASPTTGGAATPGVTPPAEPGPAPAATEADALRKTLEAEMAANRVDGGTAAGAPIAAPTAVAPGTRVTQGASAKEKKHTPTKGAAAATVPASAAASATAPASTTAGALWIQVYSSTNRDRAVDISAQLKKGGFAVKMLEPGKEGGSNYRVRVGPYADRSHADHAASRLRREFKLDTWVTDSP